MVQGQSCEGQSDEEIPPNPEGKDKRVVQRAITGQSLQSTRTFIANTALALNPGKKTKGPGWGVVLCFQSTNIWNRKCKGFSYLRFPYADKTYPENHRKSNWIPKKSENTRKPGQSGAPLGCSMKEDETAGYGRRKNHRR